MKKLFAVKLATCLALILAVLLMLAAYLIYMRTSYTTFGMFYVDACSAEDGAYFIYVDTPDRWSGEIHETKLRCSEEEYQLVRTHLHSVFSVGFEHNSLTHFGTIVRLDYEAEITAQSPPSPKAPQT